MEDGKVNKYQKRGENMENKTNLRISTKLNEEINKAKLKSEKIDIKNLNII